MSGVVVLEHQGRRPETTSSSAATVVAVLAGPRLELGGVDFLRQCVGTRPCRGCLGWRGAESSSCNGDGVAWSVALLRVGGGGGAVLTGGSRLWWRVVVHACSGS